MRTLSSEFRVTGLAVCIGAICTATRLLKSAILGVTTWVSITAHKCRKFIFNTITVHVISDVSYQKCGRIHLQYNKSVRQFTSPLWWQAHTHHVTSPYKPTVRCDLHSKWAYEGLLLLYNSGHRTTALAIKSQTPKPEVQRHKNGQLRCGTSSQKLQTLWPRNSITLVPQILPARPSVKSTKYENEDIRIVRCGL